MSQSEQRKQHDTLTILSLAQLDSRDWFAALAMLGYLARPLIGPQDGFAINDNTGIAKQAYQLADEMLSARLDGQTQAQENSAIARETRYAHDEQQRRDDE